MTSTAAIWMTSRAHDQLHTELQELLAQRHIEMPDGDSDDYALSQALHSARQARIGRIQHCSATPSPIATHPTTVSPSPAWS
ncbi:hypothetical protein [Nocardia gipuzkoensis]